MENNKYMILLVSRMNHRTLSMLRVYLGAGDGDLGRSGVGLLSAQHWGGGVRMSTRTRTWAALAKAVLTPLLWCSMEPRKGFHKAVVSQMGPFEGHLSPQLYFSAGCKEPGDPCKVRESLAPRGLS